jgi:ADP-heptose:LPS heptosyltransferase
MHVASAVGTKVVALFGASDPERTGPVGTGHIVLQAEGPPCVPCRGRRCSGEVFRACMENIGVDQVAAALLKLLGSKE